MTARVLHARYLQNYLGSNIDDWFYSIPESSVLKGEKTVNEAVN